MNVTDVDDKIIMRARRNYLLEQYRLRTQDAATVFSDVSEAVAAALAKQQAKAAEAEAALAAESGAAGDGASAAASRGGGEGRRREDLATNLAQELLLLGKAEAAAAAVAAAGTGAGAEKLLELGGDALAEALDKAEGGSVTDPAIFRAHAAK